MGTLKQRYEDTTETQPLTEAEQDAVIARVEAAGLQTRHWFGVVLAGAGFLLATMQAVLGHQFRDIEQVTAAALWIGATSFAVSAGVSFISLEAWRSSKIAATCLALAAAPAAVTVMFGTKVPTTGTPETITGEQQVISWLLLPLGPLAFAGTCFAVSRTAGTSEEGVERLRNLRYRLKGA